MIRNKSFNMFTVNMGPYSGRGCPDVRFHPAVVDWVMEGVALLFVLLGWAGVIYLCATQDGQIPAKMWVSASMSLLMFGLMLTGARLPVRFINFPVRVGAHNIGRQYVLAVRLMRAFNVCICLLFAAGPWTDHYLWARILFLAALVLMALSLVAYYVLAFRAR